MNIEAAISYREGQTSDLDRIYELGELVNAEHRVAEPALFAETSDRLADIEHWRLGLSSENSRIFVAESGGKLIGFVTVWVASDDHSFLKPVRYGRIGTVFVAGEYRNNGIGRTLVEHAESWSRSKGAKDMRLNVWSFNAEAVRIFEGLGFKSRSSIMGKPLGDSDA